VQQLYGKGIIIQLIKRVRLEWNNCHVWRADISIVKTVLVNKLDHKIPPRGRPEQSWLDVIKRDMQDQRPDWNGDMNHAYNSEEWENLVSTAKGLNVP